MTIYRSLHAASVITGIALGLIAPSINAANQSSAQHVVSYIEHLPPQASTIIDTRPLARCTAQSLPGARCLPAADLFGQHQRLANWSGLLWALGTTGLTGDEHAFVIGANNSTRDFITGLLLVAGQRLVSVVTTPASTLLEQADNTEGGHARSTTRESVWAAPMRSELIVLRDELITALESASAPTLLDARPSLQYWGQIRQTERGGHLPGAIHSPLTHWQNHKQTDQLPPDVVLYAQDGPRGLAYLARVHATGNQAQLYLGGWAEWAAHGNLPVDAASYPGAATSVNSKEPSTGNWQYQTVAGAVLAGVSLMGAGYLLGQRMAGTRQQSNRS